MMTLVAVLAGLILGSFVSVLVERLGRKEGIVAGRSQCPHCDHQLAWYDLIPLVSWAMLGGKCRYCHQAISPRYVALELVMAAVLGGYVFLYGFGGWWSASDLAILFGLVALFFFDLRWQILPDAITTGLVIVVLARIAGLRPDLLVNGLATGVFLAAVLGVLYAYSRGRWLGLGDVKLAFLMGLLFGYPGAVGVTLIAIWLGALVGVGMMIARRARMDTALPFGSFWTAVAIATILYPAPVFFLSGLVTPLR